MAPFGAFHRPPGFGSPASSFNTDPTAKKWPLLVPSTCPPYQVPGFVAIYSPSMDIKKLPCVTPETLCTTGAGEGVKVLVAIYSSSGAVVLNPLRRFWCPSMRHLLGMPKRRVEKDGGSSSGLPDLTLSISILSHGTQTAKTLICVNVGYPPIPERPPKSAQNCFFCLHIKCARNAVSAPSFWAVCLEWAEAPLFAQIHLGLFGLRGSN